MVEIADDALLPEGCKFYPIPSVIGRPQDKAIVHRETDKPLNGALFLTDTDERAERDYAYDSVGALETRFIRGFKSAHGVIAEMPTWLRQLGVYYGWLNTNRWTARGNEMRELVARLEIAPADVARKTLHKEAVKRKGESVAEGYARQKAWNDARAEEAKQRREERRKEDLAASLAKRQAKGALKAAEALVMAEARLSLARYAAGLVPCVLWVTPEAKLSFEKLGKAGV